MLFGGHVSIAGGIVKAVERAKAQGFEVIQIFASAPQSFSVKLPTEKEIQEFKKAYQEANLKGLFFHAIYLLNLASDKQSLVDLSINSLIGYLKLGDKLGAVGTIVHIGSYGSKVTDIQIIKQKRVQVVAAIKKILDQTPSSQAFIIENAAGGGGRVGATLDELIYFHKAISSSRIKFCIDTQHLYATGVDTGNYAEFSSWLAIFDTEIGIDHLVCVHTNDSKTELGSKHDRHENIGEGKIGREGFKNILKQPLLQDKPFILEVPGFHDKGPDKENVERLKEFKVFSSKF